MKESGKHINNVLKVVSMGQKNNKKKKFCTNVKSNSFAILPHNKDLNGRKSQRDS